MKTSNVTKTKSKKLTSASKSSKGKVGGISKAPKTALPKAQMGGRVRGKDISEKAAERKAGKGKGIIDRIMGANPSDDKGVYIPFTRKGKKDFKKTGSVSSKEMKSSRQIKKKGGAIRK